MPNRHFASIKSGGAQRAKWNIAEVVVELRYPKAHRYWDDCGKTISAVEQALPGLACQRLEDDGFLFAGGGASGLTSAKFYWDRSACVSRRLLEGSYAEGFNGAAETFMTTIVEQLGIRVTSRVGHRIIQRISFPDSAAVSDFWAQRSVVRLDPAAEPFWGRPLAEELTLRTQLADGKRAVTLRFANAKFTGLPEPCAVVDADFSLLAPPATADLRLADFMQENWADVKDHIRELAVEG